MSENLHPIRRVAQALGLPLRKVRGWVDRGKLTALQPIAHMERLVPTEELHRLEDKGYVIDWSLLQDE